MDSTGRLHGSSRTFFTFAGLVLLAGGAGCGGMRECAVDMDAALPPIWPAEVTFSSCEQYATAVVGNYVISSNYWNMVTCPGTQCIEVNTVTGAFSVTEGPPPCGEKVASFPNVLYGCAYGNCSPKTILPLPFSSVYRLTSSWDFSVRSGCNDSWNVAYEIWFCRDDTCGGNGFPGGFELMVWLDARNARGWKDYVGTVKLSGYTWDVWSGEMAAGGMLDSWGYMNYILKDPTMTSVTNLNLHEIIQDAVDRGYFQDSWYLYAVQAGSEVRSGGIPFNSNSFSLVINGESPSTTPLPYSGPSCDGGVPSAEGQLSINDNYVTAGSLHGYVSAGTWVGEESKAIACATPSCTDALQGIGVSCSSALLPSALCTTGAISADPTYQSVAWVGFNLNQEMAAGGAAGFDGGAGAVDGGASAVGSDASIALGSISIPNSITVSVTKEGSLTGNNSLRAQLTDADGKLFCYGGSMAEPIPIGKFNSACWNNSGDFATSSMAFTTLQVIVPSSLSSEQDFAYCITGVTVQ